MLLDVSEANDCEKMVGIHKCLEFPTVTAGLFSFLRL
jgi:hypothetical protein